MRQIWRAGIACFAAGGWAPLLVFGIHVLLSRILNGYRLWPSIDVPMHFAGGVAIGYFISRAFRRLPRESARRGRVVVLELLLIGSLTASAAVLWEFAEFTVDQLFASNVQVSLANTMRDLAMGVAGGALCILVRSRRLRVGFREVRELTGDWLHGDAAQQPTAADRGLG
jgi:hypothetical protein